MSTVSKLLKSLSAAAFVATTATAASAQDILTIADPEIVLSVAKGFGSAEMDKDSGGDPMIAGRIQRLKYVIYFYGCKEAKDCRSIQFSSGYTDPWTIEKANEWNKKFRWVKAYENEGSNFKMDVDFKGGITRQYLEEQFVTWDSFIQDIMEAVE
jgi:hypothetical protein